MNCTLLGARMRFGIATVLVSLVLGVFDVQNARASAIDDAVASAERTLGNVSAGALVVVAPVSADQPVLKSVELTQRIAGAFARTLIESRIHDVPLSLVAARDAAARARASALVYVQVDLVHGELRVVVDKYPVERNRWRRLRDGLAPSAAHGFGHAVLDVELRTFLPSVPLEQWKVSRSRLDEPNALAVACGDLGGDGGNELVIVTDAKILIGRLRDGRFLREVGMSWAEYAPRVAAPLRQPIATAVIDGLANELDKEQSNFKRLGLKGMYMRNPTKGTSEMISFPDFIANNRLSANEMRAGTFGQGR